MRYGIASAMATVAVLLTLIAGPGWFAKKTLYDTDTVVQRVDTALADERVQLAIADKVTDELFLIAGIDRTEAADAIDRNAADAEAAAAAAADPDQAEATTTPAPTVVPEPDAADPLADLPIAEALQTVANERALQLLASHQLDASISAAARQAHTQFLEVAEETRPPNDQGLITIDLEPVVQATISAVAADPLLGFLAQIDSVEAGGASFVVARDGQGGGIWWRILRSFPDWANLAVFGTIVLLAGAIALSPERDRIMLSSGVAIATIALVIAAATWAARAIVSTVFIRDEIPRGAFDAIYTTLSKPLISLEIRIAIFAAILAAIGGVLGFFLDWQAERTLSADAAQDPYGSDSGLPIYRSPYENSGIPPGPRRGV